MSLSTSANLSFSQINGYMRFTNGNVGINTTSPTYTLDVTGTCDVSTSITTAALYSTNVTATNIVGTTISAGTIVGTTLISSANIAASIVTAGTLTGTNLLVTNASISNFALSSINISSGTIGTLSSTTISSANIAASLITAGTLTATNIVGTTISAGTIVGTTLISSANIAASVVTAGTLIATTRVSSANLNSSAISTGTLTITGPGGAGTNGSVLITGGDSFGHSLYVASVASQKRVVFNNTGSVGNIFAYDYGSLASQNLTLQGPGGNVGIGNTLPGATLDVSGTARFTSSITTASIRVVDTNATLSLKSSQSNNIVSTLEMLQANGTGSRFTYNGTTDLFLYEGMNSNVTNGSIICIQNTGSKNVGIGTTSPSETLHIEGNILIKTAGSLWITGNSDTSLNRLRLHNTGSVSYLDYGGGNLNIRAGTGTIGALTTAITLTTSGTMNVSTLISSANIAASLITTGTLNAATLISSANIAASLITTGTLNATTVASSVISGTTITSANIYASGDLFVGGTITTVNITSTNLVETNVSAGIVLASTRLSAPGNSNTLGSIVTTAGNVGIGTTSPRAKLNVQGDASGVHASDSGQFIISGATNSNKRLGIAIDTTNNVGILQGGLSGTTTYPIALNPGGSNVGINTTSPGTTLDVSGTFRATTSVTSGALYATNVTATNIVGTTISAGTILGTTLVSSANIAASLITAGTLLGSTINGTNSTITNAVHTALSTGTLNATTSVNSAAVNATNVTSTNIVGTTISAGTILGTTLVSSANIAASIVTAGTLLGSTINGTNSTITNAVHTALSTGTLNATTSVNSAAVNATNVTATNIVGTTISAGTILGTTLVSSANVSASVVTAGTLVGSTINGTNSTITNAVYTAVSTGTLEASGSISQYGAAASNYNGYLKTNNSGQSSTTLLNPGIIVFNQSGTYNYGMDMGSTIAGRYRTRIFAPDTADIAFSFAAAAGATSQSGFTDRVVISGSGSMGIGTTSPGTTLDVSGTARFSTSVTSGGLFATNVTATNIVGTTISAGTIVGTTLVSSANIAASVITTGTLVATGTIKATTSVTSGALYATNVTATNIVGTTISAGTLVGTSLGIGTTAPTCALDILNSTINSNAPFIKLGNSAGGAGNQVGIRLSPYTGRTAGDSSQIIAVDDGAASSHLTFYTASGDLGASTERMRITNDGNVGIGTNNPGATLDVSGTLNATNVTATTSISSANIAASIITTGTLVASQSSVLKVIDNIVTTPVNMTSNTSNVGYTASASTERTASNAAWKAFDVSSTDTTTYWSSATTYNSTTGVYTGSVSTTVDGSPVLGEWLQLEIADYMSVQSVYIRATTTGGGVPRTAYICGSNDNVNFVGITAISNNVLPSINTTYSVTSSRKVYRYLRIVLSTITASNGTGSAVISTVIYTGTTPDVGTLLNVCGGLEATKLEVISQSSSSGIRHTYQGCSVETYNDGNSGWLQTFTNHPLKFSVNNGTPLMTLNTNGNFGIGTETPSSLTKLQVIGNVGIGADADARSGVLDIRPSSLVSFHSTTLMSGYAQTLSYNASTNGALGIAFGISSLTTVTPGASIVHERTGLNSLGLLHFCTKSGTAGTSANLIRMTIQTSGNVGVGTTAPTSTLQINGSLAKTSGTFDIKHPIVADKRLVHSFIEGPRCDLIYRGTATLQNGQATVNLDLDCVQEQGSGMTQGTFEALCANPVKYLHNNSSFDRVKGSISGNILTIVCENSSSADTVDWMVVAERKDEAIKEWNRTNADGFLITEY